jgi:hypothetical protein
MDFPAVSAPQLENDGDYRKQVLPRLKDLHRLCDSVANSLHIEYGPLDVYDLLGSIAFYLTSIGVSIEVDVRCSKQSEDEETDDEDDECEPAEEMSIVRCASNVIASASRPKAFEMARGGQVIFMEALV